MARNFAPKEGDGALFKVKDRETEQHPHYRGSLYLNGQEHWVSAWIKSSKAGEKYMSLSVKPKMARDHKGAPANPPTRTEDDFNDPIPF